jgi:hypothetical protein
VRTIVRQHKDVSRFGNVSASGELNATRKTRIMPGPTISKLSMQGEVGLIVRLVDSRLSSCVE